ncbi:MAG TPA: glycosyltransferase family 39 protein [Bryobacteraceae bacterium]|nr:glycosyltransferase family 39 protein [Bryobacteraceae bacterium]
MRNYKAALPWMVVLLVVLFAAAVRIRLLDIPLERDEGEYAYAGQLILERIPPYKIAWNMKLPGTYAAYATIMAVFGQTIAGIHLGLMLVNAATIVLLYLLGKQLFGTTAGLVACASYALISLAPGVLGTQAHATHFVVLPALAGILLLLKAEETARWSTLLWSGILLGLAFVMKQQAIFFLAFAVVYLAWRARSWRKLIVYAAALALPYGLTCLILWRAGVFDRFWFWTVTYAQDYVSQVPLNLAPGRLALKLRGAVGVNLPIWILASTGIILAFVASATRRRAKFATAFLVFSFAALSVGWYFREHYFILLLPAVALLAGAAIGSLEGRFGHVWPAALFAILFVVSVAPQRRFLFRMSPAEAYRMIYGANPFQETVEVARYIRNNSSDDSRVGILGSEPEIFFYAHRHSASGYIYMYSLMEFQPYALTMQHEFTEEIEAARPEYVVMVNHISSWLASPFSEKLVFKWWQNYGPIHYTPVGLVEFVSPDQRDYTWGPAADRPPRTFTSISVLRRLDKSK